MKWGSKCSLFVLTLIPLVSSSGVRSISGMKRIFCLLSLCLFASAAVAHQGVKDARVLAWMEAMTSAKQALRRLNDMAQSRQEFDAQAAQAAEGLLIELGQDMPVLFAEPALDPKSEALPGIWTDFDDFTLKAQDMVAAAQAIDTSNLAGLAATLPTVSKSCRACHDLYQVSD